MSFASGSVYGIGTGSAASVEIIGSATKRTKIIEVVGHDIAGSAPNRGFGRPGAAGVTPTVIPLTFDNKSDGEFAKTTLASAWGGTAPTVPTIFHRRWCGNGGGSSIIFTFPRGFILPISGTAVVWNTSSSTQGWWHIVVDE